VTVGGTTYTFVAALTGAANQVLIGGSTAQSILNLQAAINASSGGGGVAYSAGQVANTSAYASGVTATTLAVTANVNGTAGNAIATTAAGAAGHATFGAADLAGGVAGATVSIGGQTYTFVGALSHTETANEVVASSEATGLANLVAAVNGSGGAGYSANTVANTQVTAAAPANGNTTVTFTADTPGTSGNFITTAATGATTGTFSSLDFTGGTAAGSAPSAVAGDTVTVGTQTYTFVSALSAPTANQVQVLVGNTNADSLSNLANAINGGTGSGVTYAYGSSATANTSATALAGQNSITLTAINKGTAGNAIALASTGSGANTFNGATFLSGGEAGSLNDLLTQTDATAALTLINDAVATVAALRGNIGATVNRLQAASSVINNQTQNLTSAENDVTAADIPSTVANLSQYSILEQTGISALAQANQQQQLVLKLLQ